MTGGGSSRGRARRGKSKKHEATPLNDSSSSSGVQSYGDFGFVAPFEGNQGNFPSYYENPSYMPLGYYPYMPNPNTPFYNDAPMNYNESSTNSSYDHQQIEPPRSSGLFDYVFGRGGNDNDEGDSGGDVWFRPDSFLSYFFFFCSVFVLCFFLVFCLVCDGLIGDVMWFEL
jgi:hypothetical protein